MNKWALMLTPLIIIVLSFILLSIDNKDPNEVINNANIKLKSLQQYTINSTMVVSMNFFETPLTYFYNSTTFVSNGEYHAIMISQVPFTNSFIQHEQFITKKGNYTCTNIYGTPICHAGVELNNEVPSSYSSIEYIGTKKINGRNCDAITLRTNKTDIPQEFLSEESLNEDINSSTYYCFDRETGMALESLTTVKSSSTVQGMIVDVGINITNYLTGISLETTNHNFSLPYKLLSEEEFNTLLETPLNTSSQGL